MAEHDGHSYLVLSKSQDAFGHQVSGLPLGWEVELLADLQAADDFRLVHRDGSSRVYLLRRSAMLRAERMHPALAAVLLAASALMVVADLLPTGPRVAIVVCYLLLAPGYALLPFFGAEHWLLHFLLVLSLGVALAAGIGTVMSETGWWRVEVGVAATVVLVVSAVAWRTWRNRAALAHLVVGIS